MSVDPELVMRAKKLRSDAISQLFAHEYVRVHRIAHGLAGRKDVGRSIVHFVFKRAVHVLPKWDPYAEPEHWFHRYTVWVARRSSAHRPEPKRDLLVQQDPRPDAPYVAFVAALRALETQPREAFLLHYGERFDARDMARAMDCSTEAASTHLRVASEQLRMVAGTDFDRLAQRLADAYRSLTPQEELILPSVRQLLRRHRWARRIVRLFKLVIVMAVLGGLAYAAWKLYPSIESLRANL